MIVVVDTNIVFSGIANPDGTISDLLLNSFERFDFYAPSNLLEELDRHHKKLLALTGLKESDFNFLMRLILKRIDIIDIESISLATRLMAIKITENVDRFDAPFIALAMELNSVLWTGDKKLSKGLSNLGIDWVLDTVSIKKIRDEQL
ncbi:MAG: PIN domain-containing protein [Cyclobacteriaceae bacterium]|nr:PIN domain-containing protein [Cyclobacteriaceae bacterium]